MSVSKTAASYANMIQESEERARRAIEKPVKLATPGSKQIQPVQTHVLQERIEDAYSEAYLSGEIYEKWIQAAGVLTIMGACWILGIALYNVF